MKEKTRILIFRTQKSLFSKKTNFNIEFITDCKDLTSARRFVSKEENIKEYLDGTDFELILIPENNIYSYFSKDNLSMKKEILKTSVHSKAYEK